MRGTTDDDVWQIGSGDDEFRIRDRHRDRAFGGAGQDEATADDEDVLTGIETVDAR